MVVTEVPGAVMEMPVPNVFPAQSHTTKSIAPDGGDALLGRDVLGEAVGVPCPCDGVGVTALHAESGDAHRAVGEVPEKLLVGIEWRDDVIFEEKDPWGLAEGGEVLVDLRTRCCHFPSHDAARKICKPPDADGEREVRAQSVITVIDPTLHGRAESSFLGSVDDDEMCTCVGIGLLFEEFPCERPHP